MDNPERPMTSAPRPLPIMTPRLVFGACVLAFGVVLMLDTMHLVEAGRVLKFWPVILMALGLFKIVRADSTSTRVLGGVLLTIGTLILLGNLHWLASGMILPLGLVLFGGWLVFRALVQPVRRTVATTDAGETVSVFSMMAGVDRKTTSKSFRGGDATAIMGGVELDLRKASVRAGEEAILDAFALWGGVEITVPENWRIVSKVMPLMGGYEDKTAPTDTSGPVLIVQGSAIMGAVVVKN